MTLNTNTGISIGIMIVVISAATWIIAGQYQTQTSLASMENKLSMQAVNTNNELNKKIDKLDARMTNLESNKTTWSSTDMFRWAVHLQQLNKDPKKLQTEGLIVPEPDVATK